MVEQLHREKELHDFHSSHGFCLIDGQFLFDMELFPINASIDQSSVLQSLVSLLTTAS